MSVIFELLLKYKTSYIIHSYFFVNSVVILSIKIRKKNDMRLMPRSNAFASLQIFVWVYWMYFFLALNLCKESNCLMPLPHLNYNINYRAFMLFRSTAATRILPLAPFFWLFFLLCASWFNNWRGNCPCLTAGNRTLLVMQIQRQTDL